MTKTPTVSNRYLITPSLLNSWGYMWLCESEEQLAKARQDFINTLKRIPSETNEYMKIGIEFEDECYKGNTCVSPIIKGGAYQIVGTKKENIAGIDFLLYGRLDVLKGGVIYDIKRIQKYTTQKYINSHQHPFYLALFPTADKFTYLAYDGEHLHKESYYRDECENIECAISDFIKWLKANKLLDVYLEKWKCKGE